MLGDDVTAEQALSIGLVNRVVPDADLAAEAAALAERLATGPTRVLRAHQVVGEPFAGRWAFGVLRRRSHRAGPEHAYR